MHRYKRLARLASHFFYDGLLKLYSCAHIPNTRYGARQSLVQYQMHKSLQPSSWPQIRRLPLGGSKASYIFLLLFSLLKFVILF